MWFLEHYRAEASSVNCPATFRIRGQLSDRRVTDTLNTLVRNHDALRTTLVRRGRELVQIVHDPAPVDVVFSRLPAGAEDELRAEHQAELRTPIPVAETPVRWHVWRLGTDDHVLCANMHHLVSDAWSCGVLINDVIAQLAGTSADRPAAGWQYPEFTRWQHELAANGGLAAHQDYWSTKLAGMGVPALRERHATEAPPRPALATGELSGAAGDALRRFARAERTTLFPVMLALYYVLLRQETDQDDLAVASLFANRTRPEVQTTIGFFANMLVLRTAIPPDGSFRALVAATRRTVMDAVVHQAVPYQMIPVPGLRQAGARVNDVVFQMLPDRAPDSWSPTTVAAGLEIDTFRPSQSLSRFGLNLTVIPRADRFDIRLSYAADQFAADWAERFVARYLELAAGVSESPDVVRT